MNASDSRPILVTGATGNVGREVVRVLRRDGVPVRAATTRPESARRRLGPGVELVALDYQDPATFDRAVAGTRGLFLLRPPAIAEVDRTLAELVRVAGRRGVEHVVFLSVAGAEKNRRIPHHRVERFLAEESGLPWTLLRPGFFAQNLADAYLADVRDDDRLYVPAGKGRVAFVDLRDVAELAAMAFAEPSMRRQAYTLTGPEAVTFAEVAQLLAEGLGRPIRYEPASVPGFVRHLRRRGLPWGQVAVVTWLNTALRWGGAGDVDPTLAALLARAGRTPRRMADYVQDHLDLWRPAGALAVAGADR